MAESIKAEFSLGESERRKITKNYYVASIALLVIGAAGLIAYIALTVILSLQERYYEELPAWLDAFLAFAVPFACGLVFMLTLKKQYKQAAATNDDKLVYEFFSDCLFIRQYRRGEQVGAARYGYGNIIKSRAAKGYIKIYFISAAAYYVNLSDLDEAQVCTVKQLLKLPCSGDGLKLGSADGM